MSLIRQVRLLLLATLLLAFAGSVGLTIQSARATLATQLKLKNSDNAALLAQVLGQQRGDAELMALVMSAQFDTGFYRSIRFVAADGKSAVLAHRRTAATGRTGLVRAAVADRFGARRRAGLGWLARARIGRGGEPDRVCP